MCFRCVTSRSILEDAERKYNNRIKFTVYTLHFTLLKMGKLIRWIYPSLSTLLGLALTYYLWYLQESGDPKSEDIIKYGTYALIVCVGLALTPVVTEVRYNSRIIRDWLLSEIEFIYKDKLASDDTTPRVSIYRARYGIFVIFKYLFCVGPRMIGINWRKSRTWAYWKNAPWKPWGKYLCLWARYTDTKEYASQTYFPVKRLGDDDNCGVVVHCYKQQDVVEKSTSNIINFRLPKKYPIFNRTEGNNKIMTAYMSDMLMDEANYDYLRNMNLQACKIIAVRLIAPDGTTWGVLVAESNKPSLSSETLNALRERMESVSKSFTNLKKALSWQR